MPLSDGVTMVDFWVAFDKGRKKSEKGLYKIKFDIGDENKDKLTINDIEFLCTGFIQLIQQLAAQSGNPIYSVAKTAPI